MLDSSSPCCWVIDGVVQKQSVYLSMKTGGRRYLQANIFRGQIKNRLHREILFYLVKKEKTSSSVPWYRAVIFMVNRGDGLLAKASLNSWFSSNFVLCSYDMVKNTFSYFGNSFNTVAEIIIMIINNIYHHYLTLLILFQMQESLIGSDSFCIYPPGSGAESLCWAV